MHPLLPKLNSSLKSSRLKKNRKTIKQRCPYLETFLMMLRSVPNQKE